MKRLNILMNGHPALRKVAKPVTEEEFNTDQLNDLISQMSATLSATKDGVALAGPQVGIEKRIFIVHGKVLSEFGYSGHPEMKDSKTGSLAFINPVIIKSSRQKAWLEEGCLSVPNYFGLVERSLKVKVSAQDGTGKRFQVIGSRILAQIFQHEIDHLDGILFLDKVRELKYVKP